MERRRHLQLTKIGENNRRAIDVADRVLAVLDGADVDSGTAAEIGYAFAKGKPTYGYHLDDPNCGRVGKTADKATVDNMGRSCPDSHFRSELTLFVM